jgi:hypothetical protein
MTEQPDATCKTCANVRISSVIGPWCPKHPAISWGSRHDCHVFPTPCPPPGFLFTKRDGTQAPNVPMNDRKPGTPWAWPVCPKCFGKGRLCYQIDTNGAQHWEDCPDCDGTGALRPDGKGHEVQP